jgi:hypothetical protein
MTEVSTVTLVSGKYIIRTDTGEKIFDFTTSSTSVTDLTHPSSTTPSTPVANQTRIMSRSRSRSVSMIRPRLTQSDKQ